VSDSGADTIPVTENKCVCPPLFLAASFGRRTGPAPALGADTDRVLTEVLGLPADRIAALRAGGAFG